jgi:hypothetical protein
VLRPPSSPAAMSALGQKRTSQAVSFVVDWRFAAKFEAYAGFMFSQVNNGLANGYLNRTTIDPAVGLIFRF